MTRACPALPQVLPRGREARPRALTPPATPGAGPAPAWTPAALSSAPSLDPSHRRWARASDAISHWKDPRPGETRQQLRTPRASRRPREPRLPVLSPASKAWLLQAAAPGLGGDSRAVAAPSPGPRLTESPHHKAGTPLLEPRSQGGRAAGLEAHSRLCRDDVCAGLTHGPGPHAGTAAWERLRPWAQAQWCPGLMQQLKLANSSPHGRVLSTRWPGGGLRPSGVPSDLCTLNP